MNESDIERQLQQQPLARPSANLDQRMESLFHRAGSLSPRASWPAVPLWLGAAACLICGITGFAVRPLLIRQPSPPTVVVVVPLNEALARLVTGNNANRRDEIDFSRAQIRVVRQKSPASDKL
jgi:hypothetical protein